MVNKQKQKLKKSIVNHERVKREGSEHRISNICFDYARQIQMTNKKRVKQSSSLYCLQTQSNNTQRDEKINFSEN